jgi:nitroimidazol reductase NimA-like FMN-containing flavoprotein (pyridoxamine 5'-phosphate oxidase superfamily)
MTTETVAHALSRSECELLLKTARVGRVIFTDQALPAALPVNFACEGSDIVFRTEAGRRLAAACDGAIVAFEVDNVDTRHHAGWSVLVTGLARVLKSESEILRADQLGVESWADPADSRYVRIAAGLVSGRRMTAGLS